MRGRVDLERAGITHPDGSLGRVLAQSGWLLPKKVWVDKDTLHWTPTNLAGRARPGTTIADRDTLERFVDLHDANDSVIEAFAKDFGPLHLCFQHGLPMTHVPVRLVPLLDDDHSICRPAGGIGAPHGEPLDRWRTLSLQGASLLRLAARLTAETAPLPDAEDWASLGELFRDDRLLRRYLKDATRADQRAMLASAVQTWLEIGDVMVKYEWSNDAPTIDFGSHSLFGALAIQLALAVAKSKGLVVCDECNRTYAPRRSPTPGKPRRCPRKECRELAPKRDWARRNRERTS